MQSHILLVEAPSCLGKWQRPTSGRQDTHRHHPKSLSGALHHIAVAHVLHGSGELCLRDVLHRSHQLAGFRLVELRSGPEQKRTICSASDLGLHLWAKKAAASSA